MILTNGYPVICKTSLQLVREFPVKSLISFWRIGRWQQTTAARRLAVCSPPHPNQRHNLASKRTDHMTSFFHSEFGNRERGAGRCKGQHAHTITLKYTSHTVPSQVVSESTHTHTHNKTCHYRTVA